ncbi:MAG: hypothetical protein HY903_22105 [Deltaproteobacteria bacterium]|nr:hypothetical protein [Deltaproteobacteria bacterium]
MTMTTSAASAADPPGVAPRWVLLSEEARVRGFRNALAFKRWCRKRNVAIVTEGKFQWVSPAEVDRALDALSLQAAPSEPVAPSGDGAVASAVTTLMMSKRTR